MAVCTSKGLVGRRAFVGGALAVATCMGLTGCAASEDAEGSAAADEVSEPLTVCLRQPSCLDPFGCQTAADFQLVWQLFDSLTRYDFQAEEPVGLAAESWEVSEDAKTFTFHLVSGATFHNGEAVSATAFKRGWERIVNPQSRAAQLFGASPNAYLLALVEGYDELLAGSAKGLSGVACPDAETLVVTLSVPYADFPCVVAHPALAPVPYMASYDPSSFYEVPSGNGPFQLAGEPAWEDGADIELARFDGYYGGLPSQESVRFAMTDDADDAYLDFRSGDVDVADVPLDYLSDAKKRCGVSSDGCTMADDERLLIGSEPLLTFLVCNTASGPLSSANLRRGVSLAIDSETLCESVYKGTREAATDVVPPGVPGHRSESWTYCSYDTDWALAYIDSEYPVDEDGERGLALRLMYYESGGHDEVVQAISDDLAQVGVEVELEALAWDVLSERAAAGDFELMLSSWAVDFASMDNVLYPLFHSDSIGGYNHSGFANDEVDALVDTARQACDAAARIGALQDADDIVAEEVPVIPLMYHVHVIAGSDRVASLYCDPSGRMDLASVELV